jgi:hypothetical protein
VVVAAVAGTAGGYVWAASTTLPMVQTITVPAPTDVNTFGVIRYDVVPAPAGQDCAAPLLYVSRTSTVGGVTSVTAGCLNPATLSN